MSFSVVDQQPSELRKLLKEKEKEAEQMLEILTSLPQDAGTVTKSSMMKSAQILLLYSAVESMVYLSFENLHEAAAHVEYASLSPQYQAVWSRYYFTSFADKKVHSENLNKTLNGSVRIPSLTTFLNRVNLFSGNLDGRKINDLLRYYGVKELPKQRLNHLKFVKDKRNALAHGECMFKEGCRAITERELRTITSDVFFAIGRMVQNIEEFVKNKRYLKR